MPDTAESTEKSPVNQQLVIIAGKLNNFHLVAKSTARSISFSKQNTSIDQRVFILIIIPITNKKIKYKAPQAD